MRKVFFASPTYDYNFSCDFVASLMSTTIYLTQHGVETQAAFVGGMCFIDLARDDLVNRFLATDCSDLFFIDADVGWDYKCMPRILNSDKEIIAGLVPKKRDDNLWHDNAMTGKIDGGLLECLEAPTAFMRIKRSVFEQMDAFYPDLKEYKTLEHGTGYFQTGWAHGGKEFMGEDIFFCRQWVKMGGKIWIDPDIDFSHRGSKSWKGNCMEAGVKSGKYTVNPTSAAA
jgi:hypothetical protein